MVAVIDWSWEGILWSKAVINADNRDPEINGPPSSVILVRARVSHDEATSVELQNCKVTFLRTVGRDWLIMQYPDLDVSAWVKVYFSLMKFGTVCAYCLTMLVSKLAEFFICQGVKGLSFTHQQL